MWVTVHKILCTRRDFQSTVAGPPSCASVALRRRLHILMYKDGPSAERIKIFLLAETHNIGIKMKRKEITKTFIGRDP